jgi:hypothetical protein
MDLRLSDSPLPTVPFPLPVHWLPSETGPQGEPLPLAEDHNIEGPDEEETKNVPLPVQLRVAVLLLMDVPILADLEDDRSGAEFRVVMKEPEQST